jgi:sugar lactone lactonase YvrE/nitrous oxidase accessory protein NosD
MRRKQYSTLALSLVILMLASSISSLNLIAHAAVATATPGYLEEEIATGLHGPHGIAFDSAGNLYVANEGYNVGPDYGPGTKITKITPDGQVTTFADGFVGPAGLAFDKQGNLWVGDDGHTYAGDGIGYNIWKISPDGIVTPGSAFTPANPNTLAFDKNWNLFAVGTDGTIWKIDKRGTVQNFAVGFSVPQALAFDKKGNVYTCDADGTIWKLNPSGSTRTIFAIIDGNQGNFAFDNKDNLYAPDNTGKVIVISPSGEKETFVTGLSLSRGVAFDSKGQLYAADYHMHNVWKISQTKDKVVFKDNFKKADFEGWTTVFGTWTVENGKLTQADQSQGGDWTTRPAVVADCIVGENFRFEAKFNHDLGGSVAILFRYQDMGNTLFVIFHGGTNVIIGKMVDWIEYNNWYDFSYSLGTEYTAEIEMQGAKIDLYVDGTLVASDDNWGSAYSSGKIGFDTWWATVTFDDVVISGDAYTLPKKIHVYEGESIQAAVDGVFSGGKVIVHQGTYRESFAINKPVTVQGDGAIIDLLSISSAINAIYVLSNGVEVSGFTIKIPSVELSGAIWFGLPYAEASVGSTAKNNIIESGFTGILIDGSPNQNIKILNNEISAGYPIYSLGSPIDIQIKNNKLTANYMTFSSWPGGDAISLPSGANGGEIRNNIINAEHLGITFSNAVNLQIRGNTISAATAIKTDNSPSLTISNNQLTAKANPKYTSPPAPNGILTSGALSNTLINNNYIDSEQWGIYLGVSADTQNIQILKNTISAVNTAVWISRPVNPNPSNLRIVGNSLLAGYNGIQLTGLTNPTVAGNTISIVVPPGLGNPACAITVSNTPNVQITDNIISATSIPPTTTPPTITQVTGIRLQPGAINSLVKNNQIASDYNGIQVSASGATLLENTVTSSVTGIWASGAASITVTRNHLTAKMNINYPLPPYPNGMILAGNSPNALINENTVNSERFGFWINVNSGTQNIQVLDNTVSSSVTAIFVNRPTDTGPLNLVVSGNTLSAMNSTAYGIASGLDATGPFSTATINNNHIISEGYGINLNGQSNIQIDGNTIEANTGINSNSGASFTITNNNIDAATNGLKLNNMKSTNAVISGNLIYSDYWGIYLRNILGATVNNNEVYINDNEQDLAGGIVIQGSTDSQIAENTVTGDFFTGIFLGPSDSIITQSTGNTIERNIITGVYRPTNPAFGDDQGIRFFPGSDYNTAEDNVISNVHIPILDEGIGNDW